jgi:hypothetical protein
MGSDSVNKIVVAPYVIDKTRYYRPMIDVP